MATTEATAEPTTEDVRKAAKANGLFVCTWTPEDGVTRYRFFLECEFVAYGAEPVYHGGYGIGMELGPRAAMTWLSGYRACMRGLALPDADPVDKSWHYFAVRRSPKRPEPGTWEEPYPDPDSSDSSSAKFGCSPAIECRTGWCCDCGAGPDAEHFACNKRYDGTHCFHWWEGARAGMDKFTRR